VVIRQLGVGQGAPPPRPRVLFEQGLQRGLAALALPLALAVLLLLPAAVAAQPATVGVSGRVVNGTAGGAAPTGQVRVVAVRGDQPMTDKGAPIGADGSFTVGELPAGADVTYVALAEHAGVTYWSEPAKAGAEAMVRVYERTDVFDVRVERHSIAVLRPDPTTRAVEVLELLVLRNDGDRTWVPSSDGPAGPMGLLRFSLPEGATELRPGGLLGREEIFTVDRGFATTLPVLPGRQEVSFAYRIGYGTGEYVFTKTLSYPTDELGLQLPEEIAGTVVGLNEGGTVGTERRFKQYRATGLAARAQMVAHLKNLPGAPPNVLADPVRWGAVGLAGLAALAALGLGMRRPSVVAESAPDPLVRRLAELELARDRAQVDETTYRAERERLLAGPVL
jgi:hypothetical protein